MSITASNNPFECTPAIILASLPNELISIGEIEREGNDFTVTAASWSINGIICSLAVPFEFTLPPTSPGETRIDLLVARPAGLEIITGTPSSDIIVEPDVTDPDNALKIKTYTVTSESIDDTGAILIGNFVKKSYFSELYFGLTGDIVSYTISAMYGFYLFNGTCSSFASLNLISTASDAYVGKPLGIKNNQTIPMSIKHSSGTGTTKFICPNSEDYVVQPGETVFFRFSYLGTTAGNYVFDFSNRQNYTPQKTILGNIDLDKSHNGAIIKVKANSSITVKTTLPNDFSCVLRSFSGATATFLEGVSVTLDAQKGKILEPFKMATLFRDGSTNTFVLEGELKP